MVIYGILWWFMEFHGDLWDFMVIYGISWWFYGILWWFIGFYGDLWDFMVIHGILWWFMGFFYGDLWDFMVIYGILWWFQHVRKMSTIAGHRSTTGGMITNPLSSKEFWENQGTSVRNSFHLPWVTQHVSLIEAWQFASSRSCGENSWWMTSCVIPIPIPVTGCSAFPRSRQLAISLPGNAFQGAPRRKTRTIFMLRPCGKKNRKQPTS